MKNNKDVGLYVYQMDVAAHNFGYSDQFVASVAEVDRIIGDLIKLAQETNHTLMIIGDHGGVNKNGKHF